MKKITSVPAAAGGMFLLGSRRPQLAAQTTTQANRGADAGRFENRGIVTGPALMI